MSAAERLAGLPAARAAGHRAGIVSVCSAHPLVVEAAFRQGLSEGTDVLIEATCNQVNQDGGYTGMRPSDFRGFVERIAERTGFGLENLVLGGDHLGPNPWKDQPPEKAMAKAEAMVEAYVEAGFVKLHLDTSMGCAGEPLALGNAVVAARAASLARRAEHAAAARGGPRPLYVVGTEVPVPGGALEALDHLEVTTPDAARETVEAHRRAFAALGLEDAFGRVIAAVVQPGVEFGHSEVIAYAPERAARLSKTLDELPNLVFEAHSTDYQSQEALDRLVLDGFCILKVGPWLTFALREALYGLSHIAQVLSPSEGADLAATMERLMLAEPEHWRKYHGGPPSELRIQRHYSYSDRIRYYWPAPGAERAVGDLFRRLGDRPICPALIGQYLGGLLPLVESETVEPTARALVLSAVERILKAYAAAVRGRAACRPCLDSAVR